MEFIKKFFSLIWRGWKKFAHVLGIINTRILLTVSYFVIFAFACYYRLRRKDLLDRRMTARRRIITITRPIHATTRDRSPPVLGAL